LYTKDGGADWAKTTIPGAVPDAAASLAAFDALQIVVNDGGKAYVSHDNGAAWSTVPFGHAIVVGMDCWTLGTSVRVSAGCTGAPMTAALGGPPGVTYLTMSAA